MLEFFWCIFFATALLVNVPTFASGAEIETEHANWALTGFAGQMTDNVWYDIPSQPKDIDYSDVSLLGASASYSFVRLPNGASFEVEGQIVKYSGKQDNYEINLPMVARWNRFPWNDMLRTSAAFGLGLSWATSRPDYEVVKEDGSEQLLAYWMIDLDAGPKGSPWSVVARLHHRSVAFGAFGESGGANSLVVGLRFRFGNKRLNNYKLITTHEQRVQTALSR